MQQCLPMASTPNCKFFSVGTIHTLVLCDHLDSPFPRKQFPLPLVLRGHHIKQQRRNFKNQEWLLECSLAESVMQMSRPQRLHIQVPLKAADGVPWSMDWKLLARHPAVLNLDVSLFLHADEPVPTDLLALTQLTTLHITSPHPKVIPKLARIVSSTS